jgi:hypothetical protein
VLKAATREAARCGVAQLRTAVIGCCGHGGRQVPIGEGAEGNGTSSCVAQGAKHGELRAKPSSSGHMTWPPRYSCLGDSATGRAVPRRAPGSKGRSSAGGRRYSVLIQTGLEDSTLRDDQIQASDASGCMWW